MVVTNYLAMLEYLALSTEIKINSDKEGNFRIETHCGIYKDDDLRTAIELAHEGYQMFESRPTPAAPDASPGERWLDEQGGVVELRQPEGASDITGERR